MKLVGRSESGGDLNHKCSAPLSRSKNPDLETSDHVYRRPHNIGEQEMVRVKQRDVVAMMQAADFRDGDDLSDSAWHNRE